MPKSRLKKAKIEQYYSKVALAFIAVVVLAVIVIIYFSLSKTIITVTLQPETVKNTMEINIGPVKEGENYLEGRLVEKTVTGSKTFKDLTSVSTKEAKATGTVSIYNNHSSVQPLVATTRLLSDEGILFRTKETITVPAGGQVDVEVEADEEGEKGNIGPTHFTIVALWKGLQDKIYGESAAPMTGGIKDVTIASLENINRAKSQLASELKEQAIQELDREIIKENANEKILPQAVTYQILEEAADVEPESEVDQFEVTTELKIVAVVFDKNKLFDTARQNLVDSLPSDKELATTNLDLLKYSVKAFDLNEQTARLETTLSGSSYLKLSSPIFNRDKLTNKDKQDIRAYFLDFPEIQEVEVKFSPFWVFRSPALKDHIEIKIQK